MQPAIEEILINRRWRCLRQPFPLVLAEEVFAPAFYESLAGHFQELLKSGVFKSQSSWYQAHHHEITAVGEGPLAFFASRDWHDKLAALIGVEATGDMYLGLHHHPPRNSSGWVHNDFNPGWFVDAPTQDGINLSDETACSYTKGVVLQDGAVARETMRAVVMIYYLANPPWKAGDGGETGLYAYAGQPVDQPALAVPPLNNSLLAFECTPYSWHSFIANRRYPRNSVILWLHRRKEEVVARWGEHKIIYWGRGRG